jgi:hypothetical protein
MLPVSETCGMVVTWANDPPHSHFHGRFLLSLATIGMALCNKRKTGHQFAGRTEHSVVVKNVSHLRMRTPGSCPPGVVQLILLTARITGSY